MDRDAIAAYVDQMKISNVLARELERAHFHVKTRMGSTENGVVFIFKC